MSVGTQSADDFVTEYTNAFWRVYTQEPRIYYMGNQWYQVNGNPLHHSILVQEIARLNDLANMRHAEAHKKSMVGRLIKRLRGL